MSRVAGSDSAVRRRSIDALLERYVSWREECRAVREAYQGWLDAGQRQRQGELAYARYLLALDHEEDAARAYADQTNRVSRLYI